MIKKEWKVYLVFILISVGTGLLAAALTSGGTDLYNGSLLKPPLSPPAVLFPIVWTVLYILMGISGARMWLSPESAVRSRGLNIFIAQLIVNFFWSLIFFNAQAFGFAFFWLLLLWVLIIWMILTFYKTDKLAAFLQIPYLLWVTFAGYLNFMIWRLNG